MPSTMWTVIHDAQNKKTQVAETIILKYRPPVLAFVRQQGFKDADAEDIVQEVFLTLVKDDILLKADKEKGRFRSLILSLARHTISNRLRHSNRQKRGGGQKHVRIDAAPDESAVLPVEDFLANREEDSSFDMLWVQNLVQVGMTRLEEECEKKKTPYFKAIQLYSSKGLSYEDIAIELNASRTDVKNYIYQGRDKLKKHLLQEVETYSSTKEEYEEEVRYLLKYLD